jgi:hypothetical protein
MWKFYQTPNFWTPEDILNKDIKLDDLKRAFGDVAVRKAIDSLLPNMFEWESSSTQACCILGEKNKGKKIKFSPHSSEYMKIYFREKFGKMKLCIMFR